MLKPGMPAEFNDLGVQLPEYGPPAPGVGEQILSGVKSALDPREQGITDILRGPASKVAEAVVQPLKKAYVDPAVKQWQVENRADLGKGADPEALDKLAGPAGAQALRNLGSLLYGPPETYRTPEQQATGAKALAEVGEKWLNPDMPSYKGPSANPEASVGGAFANTFTAEAANLPLYLIPGMGKSGAAQGATAGFASDLLDPREGANPVMAAAGGAALGGAFDAVPHIAREAKALIQSKAAEWAAKAEKQVVVPAAEVKTLVEAPVTGELKAGAKVSYYEARKNPHGGVDYSPVQISPAGKKVGKPVTIAADDPARITQDLRGKPVVAVDEVDEVVDALRPKQGRQVVLDAADEGDALLKEGDSYRTAFDDEGTLRLDALPEGDFLVGRTTGDAPVEFKRVKLRNLQVESLRRRSLVTVETPEGPRLGWDRSFQGPDGKAPAERLIVPVNPKEKIPNSLTAPITAPAKAVKVVTSTDEFNKILDAREQLIRAEEEALLDAADAQVAVEAASIGAPVAQTSVGPRVAINSAVGTPPPLQAPVGPTITPAQALQVSPPVMLGGNGVPLPPNAPIPPAPPMPGSAPRTLTDKALRIADLLIPPTARGKRGTLTYAQAQAAAEAASTIKAAEVMQSMMGRLVTINRNRRAKWLQNLTHGKTPAQAAQIEKQLADVNKKLGEAMSYGDQQFDDALNTFPQARAEMEQFVNEWAERDRWTQAELKRLGALDESDITAPRGMQDALNRLRDNRLYVAQLYFAQAAGPGEVAKLLAKHTGERDAIVKMAMDDLSQQPAFKGLSPDELERRAAEAVDMFAGDPNALNVNRQAAGPSSGVAAVKEKRAADFRVYADLFNEWAQTNPKQAAIANSYIRGDITKSQFDKVLARHGLPIQPEDAKFLEGFRNELREKLAPWQLKALRPVIDPLSLMAASSVRQETRLFRAQAMEAAREARLLMTPEELMLAGHGNYLADGWKQLPENPDLYGKYARRIGPLEKDMFGNVKPRDFETFYVHPDAYDTLTEYDVALRDAKAAVRWLQRTAPYKANQMRKLGLTVLNPKTWGLQIAQNAVGGALKAGISPHALFKNGGFGDAVRQWAEFTKSPYAKDLTGATMTAADWIREGMRLGTIGSDAMTAEVNPLMLSLLKDPYATKSMSGTIRALTKAVDTGKIGLRKGHEAYTAIDSIAKHGVFLTHLKMAGVDLKTGNVVDFKAADRFVNGSRLGSGQRIPIPADPKKAGELIRQTSAFRVNRSFAMPDRPARLGEAAGLASTASMGTVVNDFARVAVEETRTWGMLPYRMASEPGVASASMQWGLVGLALASSFVAARKLQGLTDEAISQSYQALPPYLRQYRAGAFALLRLSENGEVVFLNTERLLEPLRWIAGDAVARPLAQQIGMTPGQLVARTAYNMTFGSLGGSLTQPQMDAMASNAGLNIAQRRQSPEVIQSAGYIPKSLYEWMSPPLIDDMLKAQMMADHPINPVPAWQTMVPSLTAGMITVGGKPEDAGRFARQEVNAEGQQDRIRRIRQAMKTARSDEEMKALTDELERLSSMKGQSSEYREQNP